MKPLRWILPSLIASSLAVPFVAAVAGNPGRQSSDDHLLAALPTDSLEVRVRQPVSLEELSTDLSVESGRLASLNALPPAHRFQGGEWLRIPTSSSFLLEQVSSLDAREVRDGGRPALSRGPVLASAAGTPPSPPPPPSLTAVVKLGDTLSKIAQRYGMSLAQLIQLNPGLKTAQLVVGSQVRLAYASSVRTQPLIAVKPTGSGGVSWPDTPSYGDDPANPAGPGASGWVWPAQGVFTSGYGWRWGRMHKGIDVANNVGTPIVAVQAGRITFAGWDDGGYGYLVEITHEDGTLTRYAHHSRLMVREGDEVQQGQTIGLMGSTGRSTGPHLHFEIHPPGRGAANPMEFLPGRA